MKVVIVNHSDSRGGSSVAAFRLLEALRLAGVDARMLVMHSSLGMPADSVASLKPAWLRKACFLGEHLDIFLHNGFSRKNLFKASVAVCGMPLHKHPWIKDADVVNLHWVNQGMLSLKEIERIDAPVVWTMHDMWNMTGVCHHAEECIGYLRQCGNCRLLHSGTSANDLSRSTLLRKKALYSDKPMHFVAVSHWLAAKAKASSLLKDSPVDVVPNPFPTHLFSDTPVHPRPHYGLPRDKRLVMMGAARLDDPVKGLPIAVEALNQLQGSDVAAVFFGDLRDASALRDLKLEHVHLGPLSSQEALHDIYAHASVVLSTSHYESLGLTLIEGMASGCVPVSFGRGGQTDIIDHLSTGYIAQYPESGNIAEGIKYALSGRFDKERIRRSVERKFSAPAVARQYIDIFHRAIQAGNTQ